MSDTDTHDQVVTKTRKKLKPPTGYKVLLHNDNYTTMEFVVYVLESIFNKSPLRFTMIRGFTIWKSLVLIFYIA